MRRGKAIGWTLVLGLVAWALVGRGLVNYDTLYALVWGRDLTHGDAARLRRLARPHAAPAGHAGRRGPLASSARRAPSTPPSSSPSSSSARWAGSPTAWARRGSTARPAALAAAIVLTRRPVLDFGARAYVDVPYLALVLGALLVETRQPRAGAPVLALLGLAGLIRPEAWLFSGAYLVWLWVGGVRDPRLWALAAAAPLLWALGDLIVTGDPLHSLTGTRDTAQRLQRDHRPRRRPGHRPAAPGRDPARARPLRRRRRRAAGARLPARARGPRRRGRRRRARRLLRAGGRGPADPRALPARARHDPRHLLRGRRLRLGRAPARAPVAAAMGVVRGADAHRPGRLHPRPGQPHRQPARRAAHPGRHPGRPARADAAPRSARRSPCPTTARCRCWRCGSTSTPSASPSPRSSGRAAAPTSCPRARASRAGTSSIRATSIRASRRRPPASGRSGRTRRGAPSRAAG